MVNRPQCLIDTFFEQEWASRSFANPVPTKLELDGIDKILTKQFIDKDFYQHLNCTVGITEQETDRLLKELRNEFLLVLPTKVRKCSCYIFLITETFD